MKYTITINQKQAMELGITNINQAVIFDLLVGVATWAKLEIIDGEVYYWVARQTICKELPILDLMPKTIYRHLKLLAENGLINYQKSGKKDCIQITEKGKSYYVDSQIPLDEKGDSKILKDDEKGDSKILKKGISKSTYQNTKLHQSTKKDLSVKTDIDFSSLNLSAEEVSEVLKIRKANKGGALSQRAVNGLAKEFDKARNLGFTNDDILTKWDHRGWKSFEADWMGKPTNLAKQKPKRNWEAITGSKSTQKPAIEGGFRHG